MKEKHNKWERVASLLSLGTVSGMVFIQLMWDKLPNTMSTAEYWWAFTLVGGLASFSVLLAVVIGGLFNKEGMRSFIAGSSKEFHDHLDDTTRQLDDCLTHAEGIINVSQRLTFIDDGILGIYEKDATEIWIVTTTLSKDVGPLKEEVFENLALGKDYTYFIPPPNDPGRDIVDTNRTEYERLYEDRFKDLSDAEMKGVGKYRFVSYPRGTLLFTPEIVLHNPLDVHNRRGFTYVATKGQRSKDEELVEIAADLLAHIIQILKPRLVQDETLAKELFELMYGLGLEQSVKLELFEIAEKKTPHTLKEVGETVERIPNLPVRDQVRLVDILEQFAYDYGRENA